jgi:pyruvate/2-oxoglutarate dehydrogenase complex dihydrolipoamide acyltransferase (E2) component
MAQVPIRIPKVSSAAFDAVLVSFLVPEGHTVHAGEPLFEVGTDKVDSEVAAATSGVVHWTAVLDETYEIGTQIGYLDAFGGDE